MIGCLQKHKFNVIFKAISKNTKAMNMMKKFIKANLTLTKIFYLNRHKFTLWPVSVC